MKPGRDKSLALKRQNQSGKEEEDRESELSKRIKKYLEENRIKVVLHMGKLTLSLDDMERMIQSLCTTYPKYKRRDLASLKAQVAAVFRDLNADLASSNKKRLLLPAKLRQEVRFGSIWSVSENQDYDYCIDLTNIDMEEEEDREHEEVQIIDLDKGEEEEQLKAMAFREAHEEEQESLEWLNSQEEIRKSVEKRVRDLADAEEDNLLDFDFYNDMEDYGVLFEEEVAEIDKEKLLEEMDFEWYESEHQAVLLAAVKERKRQTALLKEAELKLYNAEREKEAILRERDEMLTRAQKEKQDIMKERDNSKAKYRVLVEHLEERLECPMCLTVPRETPVITCKEGHLACSSCLQGWLAGGRQECPYCRSELLVGVKSLLADLVIRNIEHECNLNGCSQKVPFDDFADHQKRCQSRLVKCPGSNQLCNMMVPFCQVVPDHYRVCSDMTVCQFPDETLSFSFSEDHLAMSFGWDTIVIVNMLGTFFVRTEKDHSLFTVEVVMQGTEEDCAKVKAEIAVKDASSGKSAFNCSNHPRPLGKDNMKEFCLSVTQSALAKTWAHNKDTKRIVFFVDIKITVA